MTTRAIAVGAMLAAAWVFAADPAGAQSTPTAPVSTFGDAAPYGAPVGSRLNAPIVGIASTHDGKGYWLAAADGGVFTYGDAGFYGSDGNSHLMTPIVGIAPTPDGRGYWIASDFGGVYGFGDALNEDTSTVFPDAPIAAIAAMPIGSGYRLAGADGGVFSFGDAGFYGSMGGKHLDAPVVGIASTADGRGYWLVGADGGVFSFGDAGFYGSMGGKHLDAPVVGMASTADGRGYWLVGADGGVFSFGDAAFHGSLGATPPNSRTPVVSIAATAHDRGYWLAATDKELPASAPVPSVLNQCNVPGTAPAVEPATIMLACGDGNAFLQNLVWSSWTSAGATATGEFTHNTCTPDCADGTFVSTFASVRLAYPVQTTAGREFASISYTFADPSAPHGSVTLTEVPPTSPG